MTLDISSTIVANSDQVNAADLVGAPITVTIKKVSKGSNEQPVFIEFHEIQGKTYRPSKSMRRVIVKLWGTDPENYIGKRMTLYNEPSVKWAGQPVGGVRISHASGISKAIKIPLQVARGKIEHVTIHPLPDAPQQPQGITQQQWQEIESAAQQKGVESVPAWCSEQLGRDLQSPAEITPDEGARLMQLLTTGETQ